MKEIAVSEVTRAVKAMCISANCNLGEDVRNRIAIAQSCETNPVGRDILGKLLQNADIASSNAMPICQDTGMAVFFVTLGQEVHITGGGLTDAINEGVRQGYAEGFLRKSVVSDPIRRGNTGDNTPAVIHYDVVPGDTLTITFAPKGFGSENMSAVKMCKPSEGMDGIINFVVDTVRRAGPNPCPPIVVGVGLGGTFEKCTQLAKHALTRTLGQPNPDPYYAELEQTLLQKINALDIGPQGFGGQTTALAVHVETYPTHIAGMPCSVNINCHVTRHETVIL